MRSRAEIINLLSRNHAQFLKVLGQAREKFVAPIMTADDVWEIKLLESKYNEKPILSGVSFWDDLVGPFRRGNLYVLAGYAGTGKTTLAAQIAWAIAQQKRNVWFYCLELTPVEVLEVLVGHISGNSEPTEEQYVLACTMAQQSGFRFFDSTVYRRWDEHLPVIARTVKEHNVEMVVIDNFHYLTRADKNTLEVEGVASQRLKGLSQECNVPILLLHHLRKPESDSSEPDPTVHALRGTSALLNDASAVVLLHHPLADSGDPGGGDRQSVGKLRYAKARWGRGGAEYVRLIGHRRLYEKASESDYRGSGTRNRKGF